MKLLGKLEKEEFIRKCSVKKVFLKTSQNSQEKPLLEFLSFFVLSTFYFFFPFDMENWFYDWFGGIHDVLCTDLYPTSSSKML